MYEPEQFPGLIYAWRNLKWLSCFLQAANWCVQAQEGADSYEAVEKLQSYLKKLV
jgi:TATA-box binding protein (TBP) (component of TFIID and TFIIIB)